MSISQQDNETDFWPGCRTIGYNPDADVPRQVSFDFSNEPLVEPHFPTVFSQPLSIEVINLKMVRHCPNVPPVIETS
jgi:hypothetical protein